MLQTTRYRLQATRRGLGAFTLVELIVSVSIIALLIVVAAGIYVYAIGSQQKSTAQDLLQQNGQIVLTMIAKDIRNNRVDYEYYEPDYSPDTPDDELALIDDTADSSANYVYYTYQYISADKLVKRCQKTGSRCDPDEPNDFEQITMTDINIDKLDFYIDPTANPYGVGATHITAPRVTVVLELSSNKERFGQKSLQLQQTVNARYEEKK